MKRGHRTVVLPDYQGVGIGSILSNFIAEYYVKQGFRYSSVTSNPAFINHRKNNKNWALKAYGRKGKHGDTLTLRKFGSQNRITTSWEYVIK